MILNWLENCLMVTKECVITIKIIRTSMKKLKTRKRKKLKKKRPDVPMINNIGNSSGNFFKYSHKAGGKRFPWVN